MNNLLGFRHFKGQPFDESGSIETFSATSSSGDKDYKFVRISV